MGIIANQKQLRMFYVTFPNDKSATEIARQLVVDKVVVCANLCSPHESMYLWKDKLETQQEIAVLFKLNHVNLEKFSAFIEEFHPFETPCVLEIPIPSANEKYLSWALG